MRSFLVMFMAVLVLGSAPALAKGKLSVTVLDGFVAVEGAEVVVKDSNGNVVKDAAGNEVRGTTKKGPGGSKARVELEVPDGTYTIESTYTDDRGTKKEGKTKDVKHKGAKTSVSVYVDPVKSGAAAGRTPPLAVVVSPGERGLVELSGISRDKVIEKYQPSDVHGYDVPAAASGGSVLSVSRQDPAWGRIESDLCGGAHGAQAKCSDDTWKEYLLPRFATTMPRLPSAFVPVVVDVGVDAITGQCVTDTGAALAEGTAVLTPQDPPVTDVVNDTPQQDYVYDGGALLWVPLAADGSFTIADPPVTSVAAGTPVTGQAKTAPAGTAGQPLVAIPGTPGGQAKTAPAGTAGQPADTAIGDPWSGWELQAGAGCGTTTVPLGGTTVAAVPTAPATTTTRPPTTKPPSATTMTRTPYAPLYTSQIEPAIKPPTASCQTDTVHGGGTVVAYDPCPKCCKIGSYPGILGDTGLAWNSGAGVYLHSGEFYLYEVDLEIPGRGLDWSFERKYRSGVIYDGPLGHNWSMNYEQRLVIVSEKNKDQARPAEGEAAVGDVLRVDGFGRVDHYRLRKDGGYDPPTGYYTRLVRRKDGTFVERDYRGIRVEYAAVGGSDVAMMKSLADRHGNVMRFEHDDSRRLTRVIDTLGRPIDYAYGDDGRLREVKDFTGRAIKFAYDAAGDLVAMTSQAVTGTPNGNDFPDGKTYRYSYANGAKEERLNHNMTSITAPNEVAAKGPPRIVVTYDGEDRVVRQTIGGTNKTGVPAGGTITYEYAKPGKDGSRRTKVTDRNGNRTEYVLSAAGNILGVREYANRKLRPSASEFVENGYDYNKDGELTRQTNPEGDATEYVYDEGNADRLQRGNLVAVVSHADKRRGADQTVIKRSFRYEPIYNRVRTVTDPRGNDPKYVPQNGGANSAARYTKTFTYDYQEGENYKALAAVLGIGEAAVKKRLEAAGVPMGLGDVNGDGVTDQIAGRIIRTQRPSATLLGDSNQARIEGDTAQEIVQVFAYNRYGQLVRAVDPEGNVTAWEYYPENDPDGDGRDATPGMSGKPYGYIKQVTRDTESGERRNSGTDPRPTKVRRLVRYDRVGNVIREVDGRGIATDYVVNQLNQVVQTKRAAAHGVFKPDPGEPTEPVDFKYLTRTAYDHNDNVVLRQVEDRGNTSRVGKNNKKSGIAFVDTAFTFDILDQVIEERAEVSDKEELIARFRFDANGNRVMQIAPEGNARTAVYDERDLLYQQTSGARKAPKMALRAKGAPAKYDVRGGEPSTMTYHYDGNRNVIESVDATDTDGSGDNNSRRGGAGDRTRFIYDGFDRRTGVVDPVGNQTVFQYDPAGNVVRTLRFGPVGGASPTKDGPDALKRPVSSGGVIVAGNLVSANLLAATEYLYDEPGRRIQTDQVLFANTIPTSRPPDLADGAEDLGHGNLTPGDDQAIPGLAGPKIIGRVTTRSEYDRKSRVTFRVEDDNHVSRTFYDGADRPIKTLDPEGNLVEVAYDDSGNILEKRETDVSQVKSVANEIFLTTYFHDSLGRVQREVDNLGQTMDYRYDSRGNLVATADAEGPEGPAIERRAFKAGPRTVARSNRFGNVTRFYYDGVGRRLRADRILTASGRGDGKRIGATLEGVAAPVPAPDKSQGGGDGIISLRYEWDRNSLRRSFTDDNGNQTRLAYDNLDRRVGETRGACVKPSLAGRCDPPTTAKWEYDGDDNVIRETDENGSVASCRFDAANRRTACSIARAQGVVGTTAIAFEYDGMSRLTRASDNNEPGDDGDDSALTYAYDSLDRVLEETQRIGSLPAKGIANAWRSDHLRSALVYPNGRAVQFAYDALDRIARISDRQPDSRDPQAIAAYSYIGPSRVLQRDFPAGGTRLTYLPGENPAVSEYDGGRRPMRLRHERADGSLVVGFAHSYDRVNYRRSERKLHAPSDSERYRLDAAYRLVAFERGALDPDSGAVLSPSPNRPARGAWSLDGTGNWSRVGDETREHSSFNEVTLRKASPARTVDHDNNGNVTADAQYRYGWDYLNRLRAVTRKSDGAAIAAYSYDAAQRRIRKMVANSGPLDGTTVFYWDGWRGIEERDGGDKLVRQYVYGFGVDEVLVLDRNLDGNGQANDGADQRLFYLQNGLDSVFALADAGGKVVEAYQYDAYGRATVFHPGANGEVDFGGDDEADSLSALDNPYLFTGRRLDPETGLYYFRHRYLSPDLGRFIHRDPLGDDPVSFGNLYAYVGNNPSSLTDPSGLKHKYWERSGKGTFSAGDKGKKSGMSAKATSWKCKEVAWDPIGMAVDSIPVGGGTGRYVAKKCAGMVLDGTNALAVYETTRCDCDLLVTWTCSVKFVQYQHRKWLWDKKTGKTRTGTYTYTETKDTGDFMACKKDADCKPYCKKRASDWPSYWAKNRSKMAQMGHNTVFVPGWKGDKCDK